MSTLIRRLLVMSLCTVLSGAALEGCATPPRESAHNAPLATDALGLHGAAVMSASERWWHQLGDPQLDELIERTLASNPSLAEAGARLQLAQAQADAQHAAQLPSARLSGGETRLKIPSGFGPYLLGGQSVWFGDLGANLSWDADLWGKQRDAVAAARERVQAGRLDIDAASLLLAGAVTQSYIELYRAYAFEDIATRAQAQRGDILSITRERVAAGLDTRVELREAEGAVPQARLEITQAQSAQALARHALAALSARGADAYAGIVRPRLDVEAALPLPAELPLNLLARRPEVIAARLRIEAADADRRAAKAAFYPTVSLSALAGFASVSIKELITAPAFGYGAGAALALPLFDGGRLRAQYRGTEAGLDEAVASYDDTVLSAVRQAADQLTLIDALRSELTQQGESLAAAEDAYRLAEERYRAGLATYLSVLNAETEVLDARRQRVDLTAALALARVSLLLAVGGSFQPPVAMPAVAAR
jgi:NodT family efflux transporter outer membrane factor (OMF) lipoprotein